MKYLTLYYLLFSAFSVFSQNTSPNQIKFEPLQINSSEYNDYSPTLYKNGILFVSDRSERKMGLFSTKNFLDLFYYDFKSKPQLISIRGLNNSHVGASVYNPTDKSIIVTKSLMVESNSKMKMVKLNLFKGKLINNKIKKLKLMKLCSKNSSCGYPFLYKNYLLYSEWVDEIGKHFLYLYDYDTNTKKALFISDKLISSPTFLNDTTIVFGATIKNGIGGVDLYKIIKENNKWSSPINLKKFNSKYDDISLIYINNTEGYISSNRMDSKDHIFKFTISD